MEKKRLIEFRPYGPFDVPITDREVTDSALNQFWNDVETQYPGLPNAVGCYIFALESRAVSIPWYVGKTERMSFKKEVFQLHKKEHYRNVMKTNSGRAQIFLIARMTATGRIRKGKGRLRSITKLEELLIGACLTVNHDLANKSTAKFLKNVRVPGYMNEDRGTRSKAAAALAKLLKAD